MMDSERRMFWMILLMIPALLPAASGCDTEPELYVVKGYDNVVTLRDFRADFGSFATFAMPDSVVDLFFPPDPATIFTPSVYNSLILGKISDKLEETGYTRVDPAVDEPDLFVMVSVTNQKWFEFPYERHWWVNWMWYDHWPGWGQTSEVAYPDHYFANKFVFPNGTLFIDIVDAGNPSVDPTTIPCLWTAVLNGILTYSTVDIDRRLDVNITKAFDQSPYLGTD